ncbi:MAG: hypothetical protein JWN66_4345 [Sphingomonas bacterium]|nr:hypothetical protein [Sphingomonas bacterium]
MIYHAIVIAAVPGSALAQDAPVREVNLLDDIPSGSCSLKDGKEVNMSDVHILLNRDIHYQIQGIDTRFLVQRDRVAVYGAIK